MADIFDPEQNKVVLDSKEISQRAIKLEKEPYKDLAKQCAAEWRLAFDHQHAKKEENLLRLKLYNNQARAKDTAGDTTMFSTLQTVLASLYVDQLASTFSGREEGDNDTAENLTRTAEYDYDGMKKEIIDYDWIWDALFFNRGLVDLREFIRDAKNKIYLPAPFVIDPTTFLRDPRAVSINGNDVQGHNSARFFGSETRMTRAAMEDNPNFFARTDWKEIKFGGGTESLIEDASAARAGALGYQYDSRRAEKNLGVNAEYDITDWSTHWEDNGEIKKVRVWLANQRKIVVGYKVESDYSKRWRVVDRPLYPTSHEWDGVSIPDLTEDKQRHRAVAQNLGMKAMTADLYPNYVYDKNLIKNKKDLKVGFNKFIPADGNPNNAMAPQRKAAPNMQLLEFIYQSLQLSAEKATATSDVQQGIQSSKDRPLGETNLIASKSDTRYSLSARIFGWSEKDFWYEWYGSYKDNLGAGIDVKVIRIAGAFGDVWRPLTKENLITTIDPDIKVESTVISRARQLEERNSLQGYFTLVFADPTANKRYGLKKLGKLYGLPKDEMDRLLPPTIDERQADDENELLNKNKPVQVFAEQDHNVHLEMHSKANQTLALLHHIETHKKALMVKKVNPAAFPAAADQAGTGYTPPGTGGAPTMPMAGGSAPIVNSQTSGTPTQTQ